MELSCEFVETQLTIGIEGSQFAADEWLALKNRVHPFKVVD